MTEMGLLKIKSVIKIFLHMHSFSWNHTFISNTVSTFILWSSETAYGECDLVALKGALVDCSSKLAPVVGPSGNVTTFRLVLDK